MENAQLGRALNQLRLRLAGPTKRSDRDRAAPGRDPRSSSGCGCRPSETRIWFTSASAWMTPARAIDQRRLPLIELRLAEYCSMPTSCRARSNSSCGQCQRGLALVDAGDPGMQHGDLVFDVLHGVLQLPAPAPGLRFDAAHRGPGRLQIRLRGIDGRLLHGDRVLKRLLVQFDKKISLVHAVVVIHQDTRDLTVDARGDEGHVTVHEGVVGRNRAEGMHGPRNPDRENGLPGSTAPAAPNSIFPPRVSPSASLAGRDRNPAVLAGLAPARRCRRSGSRSFGRLCSVMAGPRLQRPSVPERGRELFLVRVHGRTPQRLVRRRQESRSHWR